ncbi:ABC transporter substrate-binding protein [uncultured Alsobacter sp.]|uniref:ABC transporter substrate-binding protein n=1 Tax=uncultured Alsobacter sp. TaxID=1748258 RepID=UPI0025D2B099|nr:ABC transporter substrate-binding protein [uncultured Alsobacter sp.]
MTAVTRRGFNALAMGTAMLPMVGPAFGQAAARGKSIIVAQSSDAYTMDPAKHSNFQTANILGHLYDSLVHLNLDGTFGPRLALSWSNPDPMTWRFVLRQGVKFHNGEEFNAEAVKFTFDRALDPKFAAPYRSRIAAITKVEVVDPFTVDFKTAAPFPTMLYSLYTASFASLIVPPKYAAESNGEAIAKKAVGTGPFRLVEWVKDDRVVVEANPDYWGGKPKLDKITFRPIKERRTAIAEIKSEGVDLISDVPPEDVPGLNRGETKTIVQDSDFFFFFFAFDTLKATPLQDKRVRQAINYAVDVDTIQKTILGGMGKRIAVTLPTSALGYDPDLKPYPYDPAKAKALLAEAGFPNGFEIPLTSRQFYYLKDKEIMEATMGYLARVGIKVNPNFLEPGVWAQVSEKKGREGLIYPGWSGNDPDLIWYPILTTGMYQSYFSNKELDELLVKGRSTLDLNERKAIYKKAGQLIKEEAPHLPLFQAPSIYAVNKRLVWKPRSDTLLDLREAEVAG